MLPAEQQQEQSRQQQEDDDSTCNFDEVSLEKPTTAPKQKKTTPIFNADKNRALEGMMGIMFRRLSTSTKVLTQSISQSLQTECISKPEPGTGITKRQSLIMSNFIGKLENEEVDDDEFSVVTESSEFVGGRSRGCKSDGDLLFRHQLSTCQSQLSSREEDEAEEAEEQYFLSAQYGEDPATDQGLETVSKYDPDTSVEAASIGLPEAWYCAALV